VIGTLLDRRRSESCWRLGDPSQSSRHARNNTVEGDISWAERQLCESADSSTSSLGVQTPNDALFADTHFTHDHKNTFSTSYDITNESDSYPAISSLEVELSMVAEDLSVPTSNYPYQNENPMTPQRASQVFDFLTAKKTPNRNQPEDRPLPALPVAVKPPTSRFSSYSSVEGSHESNIPAYDDTSVNSDTESQQLHDTESTNRSIDDATFPKSPSKSNRLEPTMTKHHSTSITMSHQQLHAGPKLHEVVVISSTDGQASRNPRGPRPLPQFQSNITKLLPHQQPQQVNQNIVQSQQGPRHAFDGISKSKFATVQVRKYVPRWPVVMRQSWREHFEVDVLFLHIYLQTNTCRYYLQEIQHVDQYLKNMQRLIDRLRSADSFETQRN